MPTPKRQLKSIRHADDIIKTALCLEERHNNATVTLELLRLEIGALQVLLRTPVDNGERFRIDRELHRLTYEVQSHDWRQR